MGPPVGWPIKYRVSGDDPAKVRTLRLRGRERGRRRSASRDVNLDWNEPVKVIRLNIDQDAARLVGVTSESLARAVRTVVSGYTVTQVRDATYLIDLVGRSQTDERKDLEHAARTAGDARQRPRGAARAGRDARIHRRVSDDLAAQAAADHHGAGRYRPGCAGRDRGRAA